MPLEAEEEPQQQGHHGRCLQLDSGHPQLHQRLHPAGGRDRAGDPHLPHGVRLRLVRPTSPQHLGQKGMLHTRQHGQFVIAAHSSAWSVFYHCSLVSMVSVLSLLTRQHGQCFITAHSSAWSVFYCCTLVSMVSLLLLHTLQHG